MLQFLVDRNFPFANKIWQFHKNNTHHQHHRSLLLNHRRTNPEEIFQLPILISLALNIEINEILQSHSK